MITDRPDLPIHSKGRVGFLVLARAANTLFFLITATYCVLTYSSFAYQQFIRPHLVSSLTSFVIWHHLWHWVALGLTSLTLVPELRHGRGRSLAWAYLVVMTGVGVVLLVRPILPEVENDGLGLRLAFLFLVPPIWLAVYDVVASSRGFAPTPTDGRRILASGLTAAVAVWAMHLVGSPLRFEDLGDLPMPGTALAFGAATSLVVHLGVFAAATALFVAVLRAAAFAPQRGRAEYWTIVLMSAAGMALIAARLVFASLSFRGLAAWLLAAEVAVALTLVWSGMGRRIANTRTSCPSALDVWFSPLVGSASRRSAGLALLCLPVVAFVALERAAKFDWDFLVQNLCLLGVWLFAFAYLHGAIRVPPGRLRPLPMTLVASALLVPPRHPGSR